MQALEHKVPRHRGTAVGAGVLQVSTLCQQWCEKCKCGKCEGGKWDGRNVGGREPGRQRESTSESELFCNAAALFACCALFQSNSR
jgi:hypothetical protein